MEIQNPRRILAVSLADSTDHLSRVIKDLTGTHPQPSPSGDTPSLAGTTHILPLTTTYYKADVPIWLDLVASPSEWAASFLSDEAKEVLQVLGGVVVVFGLDGKSEAKELVAQVGRVVREGLGGWEWDGVLLALGVGEVEAGDDEVVDEWEDVCTEWGLEFVHVGRDDGKDGGRNEFGERMGVERAREALMANDWSGGGMADGEDEFGGFAEGDDAEGMDFGFDKEDFVGLKKAIWNAAGGEDGMDVDGEGSKEEELGEEDVQKMERMMLKLQAVRDRSAGLPEEQRKRLAQQAVDEVMKEF
ncbi:hypothetical protein OQA88_6828 [Cercophora sp. LCS_1]